MTCNSFLPSSSPGMLMYSENTGSITTFTNATILGANTISSAGKKVAFIVNMAGGGADSVLNVLAVQDGLFFVMVQVGRQHSRLLHTAWP